MNLQNLKLEQKYQNGLINDFYEKTINYFEDRFKESLDTNALNIARNGVQLSIYEINNLET